MEKILLLAPIDALVVYACWRASRRTAPTPWLQRFWVFVMAAWVFELIADLILVIYDIALEDPTFPSVADLFFLCFYPLLIAALLQLPTAPETRSQRMRSALDCATIVLGGGVAIWYFVLGRALTSGAGSFLETAVTIAYPVGDLILLGGIALVMIRGYPPALRRSLWLIGAGLVLLIIADTSYGYQQLQGTYSPGDPVDALFVLLAVPFLLGAVRQRRTHAGEATGVVSWVEAEKRVSRLPLVAVAVAIAVLAGTQWHDKFFPDLSLLMFVVAIGVLSVIRQYVAQRDLLQLRGRMSTIVERVADGIVTFGEDGRIVWANPAAALAFQTAPGELEGEAVDSLFEGVSWAEMAPNLGIGGGRLDTILGRRLTLSGQRRDGATFPLEMIVTDARLDGERVLIAVGQDVTVRKEAERVKDEFVSVVGHELRTPLTSIRGSLGLLEGGVMGELPAEANAMLATAIANTDRLVRLINDILDIERLASGRSSLELERVSAPTLVEQSIQVVEAVAAAAGVEIRSRVQDFEVMADSDRIVQTLTNLIGNAIKFSDRGGTVEVAAAHFGSRATFSVSDTGRGIPVEQLGAIFERFSQVDASDARDKGGTGLGLAIARGIVEQHGGRIWAESREGEGTTLLFTLPLAEQEGER